MKRPKARFLTEAQILAAIDRKLAQADAFSQEADSMITRAKGITRADTGLLEQAEKLHVKANRIKEQQLPKLKRQLAAFRTMLLPGCGDDVSVPK